MLEKLYKNEYERTRELVQAPDWYLEFGRVRKVRSLALGAIQAAFSGNITEAASLAKRQTIDIFEQLLAEHEVRLGIPGQDELDNHDEDREAISQIVIHHSSRAEGISLPNLSALQLLSLYVPRYQSKSAPVLNSQNQRQPIFSGHFNDKGEQVFYGYHWLVGKDGKKTRLLADDEIGWHAGNWEVNKRSAAICIDDDLAHSSPTDEALESVAQIIRDDYPAVEVTPTAIVGHNEATLSSTECPGDQFVDGWKSQLLERVAA